MSYGKQISNQYAGLRAQGFSLVFVADLTGSINTSRADFFIDHNYATNLAPEPENSYDSKLIK